MRALGLMVATGLTMTGVAHAEPQSTLVVQGSRVLADNQRAVAYGDLQLASAEGRAELQQRVAFAIADMCDASRFSAAEPQDALKCRAEAWAGVRARLDQLSPRLASR